MTSPLAPKSRFAARSVVATDMMPTRGSILAPVEHLGHGLASRPTLWLRLLLRLRLLRLRGSARQVFADQIGRREFVAFPANVNDVAWVRDEVLAVVLPALGLADDVVRVESPRITTDATGSPRLWVAPRHALPRDASAFKMSAYLDPYEKAIQKRILRASDSSRIHAFVILESMRSSNSRRRF